VFDRFRQADSSTTRAHGGLGLGLAIVRHIVEQHGGEVSAASPGLGQGATFTVAIPLNMPVADADTSPGASGFETTRTLGGVKVVLVDDEADARELTTALLEAAGAEVVAVASSAEALAAIERIGPDVLVTDIGMPTEDGYALIREVRARGHGMAAVALTAYGRGEDRERALAAGFQAHIAKPLEPAALAATIATVVGRPRLGTQK
jgi:CheY-like chemotaxis protein